MALLVPSVVFAFNAYISYRERALCAIYLASVVASGPAVFIGCRVVALVLTVQALPLLQRRELRSS